MNTCRQEKRKECEKIDQCDRGKYVTNSTPESMKFGVFSGHPKARQIFDSEQGAKNDVDDGKLTGGGRHDSRFGFKNGEHNSQNDGRSYESIDWRKARPFPCSGIQLLVQRTTHLPPLHFVDPVYPRLEERLK